MELAYCHPSGAQNFELADRFLETACSDVGIRTDVRAPDSHREPQKICYLVVLEGVQIRDFFKNLTCFCRPSSHKMKS